MSVAEIDLRESALLAEHISTELCERNFADYFREAWEVIEPGTALQWNWHHDCIAEYLTACYRREIKRLIINIPPRNTKSNLVTVAFPTWVWAKDAFERFMFASYEQTLSTKHSVSRRRILESPWYQRRWGNRFRMTTDQNVKTEYENNKRGHMVATSMQGAATGKGGNFLVIDDPHDPLRAESDVQRQAIIEAFDQKLSTRLDDKQRGVIIVIMQRVHHADLTGHLLKQGGWEHLKIAGRPVSERVYNFPVSGRKKVQKAGECMHPDREGDKEHDEQKKTLGSYGYSAQYDQEPTPRGGGLIKEKHWQFYDELPKGLEEVITFWDMATKDPLGLKTAGKLSYVCGMVWARKDMKKYALGIWRKHAGFSDSVKAVIQMKLNYPQCHKVLIEDKANGPAVVNVLKKKITGVQEWAVGAKSKEERFFVIEPDFEAGNWYLPKPDRHPWVSEFIDECTKFPLGDNDDQVDCFTGAGNYFVQRVSNLRKLIQL